MKNFLCYQVLKILWQMLLIWRRFSWCFAAPDVFAIRTAKFDSNLPPSWPQAREALCSNSLYPAEATRSCHIIQTLKTRRNVFLYAQLLKNKCIICQWGDSSIDLSSDLKGNFVYKSNRQFLFKHFFFFINLLYCRGADFLKKVNFLQIRYRMYF